jgi:anaerobic ribonucleoside-triphosphate reductase
MTKKIFDHSSQVMVDATYSQCPRCKGFGGIFRDQHGEKCYLCGGEGELWRSESGWTLRRYGRVGQDELLY